MRTKRTGQKSILSILAGLTMLGTVAGPLTAQTETLYGVETPQLRSRAEVEAVFRKAPKPAAEARLRPLTILFAGGAKDHLPKTHSHDVLPKRWKVLLGGAGPGDEAMTNLYRPQTDADRALIVAGAPRVTALSTLEWPTEEQFATADVGPLMTLTSEPSCCAASPGRQESHPTVLILSSCAASR